MNASDNHPRRLGWRWPLILSFVIHGLLVFLFSVMPEVEPPTSGPEFKEWEVPDSEKDYVVMDIYEPTAPVQPRVIGLPPSLSTPSNPPALATTAQAPTVEPAQPSKVPVAVQQDSGKTASSPLMSKAPVASANGTEASPATSAASTANQAGAAGGTSFFQVPASAHSIVYVIDRSGSMGLGGRLTQAQQELEASLARLPETAQFQVIGYNRRADFLRIAEGTGLLAATASNKQAALLWLKSLLPEGATDHMAALKQALLLAPDVIYFLTDAGDLKPEQVHALTQLNHSHTAIHTIELTPVSRDQHATPLQELATSNHGQYQAVGANR